MSRSFLVKRRALIFFPVRTVTSEGKLYQGLLLFFFFWLRCFTSDMFSLNKIFGCITNSANSFLMLWRRWGWVGRGTLPQFFTWEVVVEFQDVFSSALLDLISQGRKIWLCRSPQQSSCQLPWSWAEAGLLSDPPQSSGLKFVWGFPPRAWIMPGLWAHAALALHASAESCSCYIFLMEINLRKISLKVNFDFGIPSGLVF